MACPLAYRLGASALRDAPVVRAPKVLYVVGGLYGNTLALRAIRERAAAEPCGAEQVRVVFNGDFNFFNATPAWWRELNGTIHDDHVATAGNVEIESGGGFWRNVSSCSWGAGSPPRERASAPCG